MTEDLKTLRSLLKDMDEQVKWLEEITKNEFEDKHYKIEMMADFEKFTEEQVSGFTPQVISNVIAKYYTGETKEDESYDAKIERCKADIVELCKSSKLYFSSFKQRQEIAKEVEKQMSDYSAYLASAEVKEREEKALNDMKERLAKTTDATEAAKVSKRIHVIEASDSLSFIFDRIEKLQQKEIDNIVNAYFDKKRTNYIMERYKLKSPKYGYKPEMAASLIGIEEKFLPEEYHDFNDLFLFNLMRMVAYSDPDAEEDSLYIRKVIMETIKLVFNRFSENEDRDKMIEIIKKFDDKFESFREKFHNENSSAPGSEYRKNLEENRYNETIKNATAYLLEHDALPDTSDDEALSIKEKAAKLADLVKVHMAREKVTNWLKLYEIPFDENASTEELEAIVDEMKKNAEPKDKEPVKTEYINSESAPAEEKIVEDTSVDEDTKADETWERCEEMPVEVATELESLAAKARGNTEHLEWVAVNSTPFEDLNERPSLQFEDNADIKDSQQ